MIEKNAILLAGCFAAIGLAGVANAADVTGPQNYILSCSSDVDEAIVFTEPDTTKRYEVSGKVVRFPKHTDFIVDQLLEKDGQQFLSGEVKQYSRGRPHSILRPDSDVKDRTRFYGLPEQWDCTLYRGDREARCSGDAAILAYAKLYKECHPEQKR